MIRVSGLIYESVRVPEPPELRRSSRNESREYTYQEHEDIKKYYKNKKKDLTNVVIICKNIKYVKYRKMIIERFMIEKYGESFGSVLTSRITEDYLMIPHINLQEDESIIYEKSYLYLKAGLLPKTINDNVCVQKCYRETNNYLNYLKILPDPRTVKYISEELCVYLRLGYKLVRVQHKYILKSA